LVCSIILKHVCPQLCLISLHPSHKRNSLPCETPAKLFFQPSLAQMELTAAMITAATPATMYCRQSTHVSQSPSRLDYASCGLQLHDQPPPTQRPHNIWPHLEHDTSGFNNATNLHRECYAGSIYSTYVPFRLRHGDEDVERGCCVVKFLQGGVS
jgi:hypothetical protein